MSEARTIAIGDNRPPVTAPTSEDMLADLRTRFPEVDEELSQIEKDLATYPKKLTLKDADVAKALQDLLAKAKKLKTNLAGYKKEEKKPWDGLVKVVQNFFTTREEKLAALLTDAGAIHEDYLQQKKDEAARLLEEQAEQQRQAAETARLAREAEERRAAEARERAEAEARREAEARERAAAEEAREREAKRRREEAEAEERRLADERKARERAEKETNADNLKKIRGHMKEAEKLNAAALEKGDETSAGDIQQLDALIKPGGIVSLLAAPVANSDLLDEAQRVEIEETRARVAELRKAVGERLDAKERRRRAKEAREADEREKALVEERRLKRVEEERLAAEARERREAAEREQAAAGQGKKAAQADAREARGGQNAAFSEERAANKGAAQAEQNEDRALNRAGRLDRKLENSTDADLSRTRGDLGSVGSLKRYWKHNIVDAAALQAALVQSIQKDQPHYAVLAGQLNEEDLNGAVFRFMRLHQGGWGGRERVDDMLAGVVFTYESDAGIKG